jgi:hypothetical protein
MLERMRAPFGILLLIGCGSLEVERSAHRLTDAEPDPGHPGIGRYLFRQDGRSSSCTATLVGARTVLTAAHCVGYPEGEVELGEPPRRYPVTRDLAHPDWSEGRAWAHDLGLVFLEAAPPIPPIPVDLRAPASGEGVTLVGFGETALNAGDNGQRRRASNQVATVEELYMVIEGTGGGEGNACRGDSGGPVLSQGGGPEGILGVLSYVPNLGQGCGEATWAVRLDRYELWLTTEAGGDLSVVDRGELALRILSPLPDETVTSPVSIEVYARDDRGLAALEIVLDGIVEAQGGALSYSARRPLALGPHQLEARLSDPAGRSAQARVAFVVGDLPTAEEEGGCRHTQGRGSGGPWWWGAWLLAVANGFRRRRRDVACRPTHRCLPRRHAQVDRSDPGVWRLLGLRRRPRG